jgi:hypothetical protein
VLLKGNLHAHSMFSDGVRPAGEVIAAYEALGYDFLALTDHDDRVPPDYWHALASFTPRLLLFHGIEIDYRPLGQHVGQVHGDREVLHILNHPARYDLSLDETLRRVQVISADGLSIDAVEVTDTGQYRPRYDTDAIRLPRIATDDAHFEPHWGRAWIEVEARRDRDAIIRAIKGGNFRLGFAAPPDTGR